MQKQSLSLSDLVALQKEIKAAPPRNLKSVTRIKPLDQIPMPNIPQPQGGKRSGAGRPKTAEQTTVVRVPIGCLDAVQQIIAYYKNADDLNSVTQIKIHPTIVDWSTSATLDASLWSLKEYTNGVPNRYRLIVDGAAHIWSGRGVIPTVYANYMQQQGHNADDLSRPWLEALRITEVSHGA